MISHLSGTLLFASDRLIVVDVGGVGYKVRVALDTLRALRGVADKKVSLWTHLVVREDALDLYGFQNEAELEFFEMLISVSGIGPKGALGILNVAPVDHLKEAIAQGDASALTKVSGIGSKSAQKIVLELREKVGGREGVVVPAGMLREEHDAIAGLVALGFPEREAREALKDVPADIKGTSARIKYALKHLGK
ncbi:MAG: Holliday junction DNA helicase RuvA [Candidatus Yonathbacteria bacterium RIFCSPLOWO2_01_FULL_47_33b]|uniref:Holliday junction branch migration complex subunit RuvA n=1 Tax=Candidatus Yonathbacteria bacterium RIFCSPLOWO2_01_FULL_47_33b TaxID=1802727 RepID=A0A1G2SF82_9BACT|nr:MAG: Holliday junction DNA helicase RuvA [Candidatus Yonathbacteria bacterium RIFCSPLOWO2_01_FULL_47_33b]